MSLENLTESEEARLKEYRDELVQDLLSPTAFNRESVDTELAKIYAGEGLEYPGLIVTKSVLHATMLINLMDDQTSEKKKRREQIYKEYKGSKSEIDFWFSTGCDFALLATEQYNDNLIIPDDIDPEAVRMWSALKDTLEIHLEYVSASFGVEDGVWTGFYSIVRDEFGAEYPDKENKLLDSYHNMFMSTGIQYTYDEAAIVVERPIFKLDQDMRLHCENGPAILCSDGLNLYFWGGQSVPKNWIEGPQPSAQELLAIDNTELRRTGCEIVGWVNVIDELNPVLIDEDDNPMVGTLYSTQIPDVGEQRFLKVLCGTGRTFVLPVPTWADTAREANASTYEFTKEQAKDFYVEIRT